MTLIEPSPHAHAAPPAPPVPDESGGDEALGESRLLDRLRAGDETAFAELVHSHASRLLAVARRLLRHEQDAEDAVQDGFVSAFRALPAFRGDCRLSTWLHRIVVNAALMKLRARRHRPEQPIDDLLPVYQSDGHHQATFRAWTDIEAALSERETRARVRSAIDRLPDTYRTVLLLRDLEDLDTQAVAKMLGVTANAVKIRLHRARQALVTRLAPTLGRTLEP